MLTAKCDLCGTKGVIADFIFPRNNEPSFLRQMDFTLSKDEFGDPDEVMPLVGGVYDMAVLDTTVYFYLSIMIEGAGPETTICKACFWKGLRKLMDTYGPATPDTASPSSDIDMRPVQSEQQMSQSGADVYSDGHEHVTCHRTHVKGQEYLHCSICGALRSNW